MAQYDNCIADLDDFFFSSHRGDVYSKTIAQVERMLIEKALMRARGNQLEAAEILGIHRNTLHSKIQKLRIAIDHYR